MTVSYSTREASRTMTLHLARLGYLAARTERGMPHACRNLEFDRSARRFGRSGEIGKSRPLNRR